MKQTSIAALYTFSQVAQYPSLSSAAKAMHLTTGAISQQLIQLEQQLGFSLFERHSRGVTLTEQGEILLAVLQRSFQEIDATLQSLSQRALRKEVRLKLTPSFAYKWLVPRLEDFYRQHPDIQVQTFAEGALVDSERGDFDLAIDYGPIPYPRASAELLLEEALLPVMSPSYLSHHSWIEQKEMNEEQWQSVVLLHDAMPWAKAPRDHEWLFWATEMNVPLASHKGHFFNRTDMAMSAAEAGVGIALARTALLNQELELGRLVAPFPAISARAGYYLIMLNANEHTEIFAQWLRRQIKQLQSQVHDYLER